jgi:hypothetical protein
MEKKLFFIILLSVGFGGLSIHWLNLKVNPEAPLELVPQKPSAAQSSEKTNPSLPSQKPLQTSLAPELKKVWQNLSENLYRPNQDFKAQEIQLRDLLQHSSQSELRPFVNAILDSTQAQDRRTTAAYLLTLAGPIAIPLLTEIAATSIPADADQSFEAALRSGALERLDRWALEGQPVVPSVEFILRTQTNPTLKFFARISLEGVLEKKPGKLLRLAQKSMENF